MKKSVDDILEDIQQAQVRSGGIFLRRAEIEEMTVGALLRMLTPNGVEFKVKHTNEKDSIFTITSLNAGALTRSAENETFQVIAKDAQHALKLFKGLFPSRIVSDVEEG